MRHRPTDLGDIAGTSDALSRVLTAHPEVHLSDLGLAPYAFHEGYQTLEIGSADVKRTTTGTGRDSYSAPGKLGQLYATLDALGIPKAAEAVDEAVENGILHGNKVDPQKRVWVHSMHGEEGLHVCVEDEGGRIPPVLLPYLLLLRDTKESGGQVMDARNFYQFAGRAKPKTRRGEGTIIIHDFSDEVRYGIGPHMGLVVDMYFKTPKGF
jgi:hypothetical protein